MIQLKVLQNFRQTFGLSQHETATVLGTTRSQINLAEKGLRPIPIDVGIRLLELMEQVDAGKKEQREVLAEKTSDGNSCSSLMPELEEELVATRSKLSAIDAQLNRMEQDRQRLKTYSKNREQLVGALQLLQPDKIALHQVRDHKIRKKLCGCDADKQLRLQLQRDLLLAKANVLSQYLGSGE